MSALLPVDLNKECTYRLIGPDGIPWEWLWRDLTWHGPTARPRDGQVLMSPAFAYSQGYRFAQGFTPPSDPKPAESASPPPVDELLPPDQSKRVLLWLWKGGRHTRWFWEPKARAWEKYGELGAVVIMPSEAWERGLRLSVSRFQPAEPDDSDATPPERPALYRMRAEGLTLEGFISARRSWVATMRRKAEDSARAAQERMDQLDMVEAEINAIVAALVRVDPKDTP